MKKIGLFVGKFLPVHVGHINQIKKCSNDCDELIVVIADSKKRSKQICKDAGIKTIYAKTRLKWLKKCLKSEKNIKFRKINQGMLEVYPNDLSKWKKKLKRAIKQKIDIWFIDKNYLKISKQYFPEYNFEGFDRSEINISATEIRNNFEENIKYIAEPAKTYFIKNLKSHKS